MEKRFFFSYPNSFRRLAIVCYAVCCDGGVASAYTTISAFANTVYRRGRDNARCARVHFILLFSIRPAAVACGSVDARAPRVRTTTGDRSLKADRGTLRPWTRVRVFRADEWTAAAVAVVAGWPGGTGGNRVWPHARRRAKPRVRVRHQLDGGRVYPSRRSRRAPGTSVAVETANPRTLDDVSFSAVFFFILNFFPSLYTFLSPFVGRFFPARPQQSRGRRHAQTRSGHHTTAAEAVAHNAAGTHRTDAAAAQRVYGDDDAAAAFAKTRRACREHEFL